MKQIFPILLALLIPTMAFTSLIEDISIEQMTNEADYVIIGNVENKVSRWEGDQIVTDVQIVVNEVLSGQANQRIQVTYPGGEIGELGLNVSNVTIPDIGDKVLTFLKDNGKVMSVLYGNHGQFVIDRDKAYRASIVVGAGNSKPKVFILEDLKNQIKKAQ